MRPADRSRLAAREKPKAARRTAGEVGRPAQSVLGNAERGDEAFSQRALHSKIHAISLVHAPTALFPIYALRVMLRPSDGDEPIGSERLRWIGTSLRSILELELPPNC
jgi:hypothetical protein